MKEVHYWLKNSEHAELLKIKGDRTWRGFTLDAAGIPHGSIPRGRPQSEMDNLFQFDDKTKEKSMDELFEFGSDWKKKKER